MQDPALTGAQVLGEDHVVFGGVASEHEQAVIKRKRLSVIQIQLVQVCYGQYIVREDVNRESTRSKYILTMLVCLLV